jgi:hypothetical protein
MTSLASFISNKRVKAKLTILGIKGWQNTEFFLNSWEYYVSNTLKI